MKLADRELVDAMLCEPAETPWYDLPATTEDQTMSSVYLRGRVFWCSYTGHDGKRRRETCGTRDRRAAQQTAARREHLHWLVREGLMPIEQLRARDRGREPLDSIKLTAGRDNNVAAFLAACSLSTASDFGSDGVVAALERWLREQRDLGLVADTVNRKLWSVQRFGDWLWRNGYIATDATKRVRPIVVRGEARKIPHDALTPVQAEALFKGDFGLFYRFRCWTGLRGSEAAKIERRDLNLGDSPTLTVRPEVAKNGYGCTVPIARPLAASIAAVGMTTGRIFAEVPADRAKRTRLMREHIEAAGFGKEINGRSLRMAFVTWLEAAGVELGIRMKLRRDRGGESVRLTNITYSDPKQVMAILRDGIATLENWYARQLTAKAEAVPCA